MVADRDGEEYRCEDCEETFERREELDEHAKEVHDATPEEEAEEGSRADENGDTAAADTDASGSTGSITEENNDAPSAAEPAEAAGPSGSDDDVRPDTDDGDGDDS